MKNTLQFILLTLTIIFVQVLIINNIELTGYINPFVYIYSLLIIPFKVNRIATLFIGFTIGITIDAFCGTWGMHAAATTLTAFVRPYIFNIFASQEDKDKQSISYNIMPSTFMVYSSIAVAIHHLALFLLEAFTFNHLWHTLLKTLFSSLIAIALIYCFERIRASYLNSQKK